MRTQQPRKGQGKKTEKATRNLGGKKLTAEQSDKVRGGLGRRLRDELPKES